MRTGRAMTIAAALVLAATATASAGVKPAIRFAGLVPARAQGLHFEPGEKVRVTLLAGTSKSIGTAHASGVGAFMIDFGRIADKDRCSGSVSLVAVGASGDRAVYKLPLLACPTASTGSYTR